ncbi:DUF3613 domain-containing protein [Paraburkholderia sp. BCC1885]|uniref:DUF3613 domain-containing protein n=1 Tax=Paraburkholderia sp. BCC1885 TaxID=2562669 RepID=UPI00118223F6|nr:DUF3613 domain-containing protein [Paraburkholderia sp. BCC1885]
MKKQQTNRVTRHLAGRGRGRGAAWLVLALVAIGGMQAARAQSDGAQSAAPVRASEIDHATSQWLALQRGNTQAAPEQPMLGSEASLAYKRYLESFNSKIPDFYGSSIGQGNGGASLGGAPSSN